MKFFVLNRKIHSWLSIAIALPVLVMTATGLLLQFKKQAAWIQPPERRGTDVDPTLSLSRILDACRAVPEAGIRDWSDIDRLDVRPGKAMLKVQALNRWEIQLDLATAEVLQVAYRRSDWLESLHDGSGFHTLVKWGLFVPSGVGLLILWVTGIVLFVHPRFRRRGRASGAAG